MSFGKFEVPACKLEVKDVHCISNLGSFWAYKGEDSKFRINVLWLQGVVKDISTDKDEMMLQDENKRVCIINCSSVPGGSEWLRKDMYVMVVGEIIARLDEHTIKLKAMKVSDLSNNSALQKMWPLEVKEAKILYEKICKV